MESRVTSTKKKYVNICTPSMLIDGRLSGRHTNESEPCLMLDGSLEIQLSEDGTSALNNNLREDGYVDMLH